MAASKSPTTEIVTTESVRPQAAIVESARAKRMKALGTYFLHTTDPLDITGAQVMKASEHAYEVMEQEREASKAREIAHEGVPVEVVPEEDVPAEGMVSTNEHTSRAKRIAIQKKAKQLKHK